jgi:threonine synthase
MEGCAPLVEAFRGGAEEAGTWEDPRTDVWGLRVPRSIADFLILRAVRESGGTALTVPEASIEPMIGKIARQEGMWIGPEGAAALVATKQMVDEGIIEKGQRVVVFQTGHPANYL